MRITLLSLLCMVSPLVSAQLNHFPHGQEILFQKNNNFIRATYDSVYIVQEGFYHLPGNYHQLIENHRVKLPVCYENANEALHWLLIDFGLSDLYFSESTDSLFVFSQGIELCRVSRFPRLGDEVKLSENLTVKVVQRLAYSSQLDTESIWVIKQTDAQAGKTPVELHLADKFGWVLIQKTNERIEQIEHLQSGQIAKVFPNWQDFFPERAGDRKQFITYLDNFQPNPGRDKGFLDSFVSVQITPDTIFRVIKRWTLDSANRLKNPGQFTDKAYANKYPFLKHALDPVNIANPIIYDGSDGGLVSFVSTSYNSSTGGWNLSWHEAGYYYFNMDSCQTFEQRIFDNYHNEGISTVFGYTGFNRHAYSYWGTNLVAAEVGNQKMGHNVGVDPVEKPTIEIYPNPSTANWSIRGCDCESMPYKVLSSDGKMVSTGTIQNGKISGEALSPGLYFLLLETAEWTHQQKLIKK